MWRLIKFVIAVAVLVAVAVWLANHPGAVTVQWQGYEVRTTFAFVVLVVAVLATLAAVIYHFWRVLRGVPRHIGESLRERRRRKGYLALTRGLVAAAAGDAGEAERQAKKADGLLEDPPLTMLLQAQTAQLKGDDEAATRFFEAMAKRPGMEFLGLRGLLTQARMNGRVDEALALARRAFRLKPDTAWVAETLFDLQVKEGQWRDAADTLDEMERNRLLDSRTLARRRAVVLHQRAGEEAAAGDLSAAVKLARKVVDPDRDFVPGALRLAGLWEQRGKAKKALGTIEEAWARQPHPDLKALYEQIQGPAEAMDRLRRMERLTGFNPDDRESRLAMAEASLNAELWGEARKYLRPLTEGRPNARVCRLMAELEEAEHGDVKAARDWLARATEGEPEPAWTCTHCGEVVAEWHPLCPHCATFDGLTWRRPARVTAVTPVIDEEQPPVLAAQAEPAEAGDSGAEPAKPRG